MTDDERLDSLAAKYNKLKTVSDEYASERGAAEIMRVFDFAEVVLMHGIAAGNDSPAVAIHGESIATIATLALETLARLAKEKAKK